MWMIVVMLFFSSATVNFKVWGHFLSGLCRLLALFTAIDFQTGEHYTFYKFVIAILKRVLNLGAEKRVPYASVHTLVPPHMSTLMCSSISMHASRHLCSPTLQILQHSVSGTIIQLSTLIINCASPTYKTYQWLTKLGWKLSARFGVKKVHV